MRIPSIKGYTLKLEPAREGCSESQNIRVKHLETKRSFVVRVLNGAYCAEGELNAASAAKAEGQIRYFAAEAIPNGRIGAANQRMACAYAENVPGFNAVRNQPSEAVALVEAAAAAKPKYEGLYDFYVVYSLRGFSTRSIFYDSLESAIKSIKNAIEADMWLLSHEPVRTKTDPDTGASGSMEIWSLIRKYKCWEHLEAVLTDIKGYLEEGHFLQLDHWHSHYCNIEVYDSSREYPDNFRLGLTFDMEKRSIVNDKGIRFYREGYADIAHQLLGSAAVCYQEAARRGGGGARNNQYPRALLLYLSVV